MDKKSVRRIKKGLQGNETYQELCQESMGAIKVIITFSLEIKSLAVSSKAINFKN